MGEDEHRPVVCHSQADELQHDVASLAAFLGVDAEVGEVIHYHHLNLVLHGDALYLVQDAALVGHVVHQGVVDVGDEEVLWHGFVLESLRPLLLRQLEVDVEHTLFVGLSLLSDSSLSHSARNVIALLRYFASDLHGEC